MEERGGGERGRRESARQSTLTEWAGICNVTLSDKISATQRSREEALALGVCRRWFRAIIYVVTRACDLGREGTP